MNKDYWILIIFTLVTTLFVFSIKQNQAIERMHQPAIFVEKPIRLNLNGVSDIKINMTPCRDQNGMVLKY